MQTTSRTDGQSLMETPTRAPRQGATPAKSAGKSAQGKTQNTAKGAKGATPKGPVQKTQQTAKQSAPTEDDESDVQTDGITENNGEAEEEEEEEEDDGQVEGGEEEEGEDDDEEGEDVVPAGKVGDDGKSVVDNEGSVIGSVSGKGNKGLIGKVVDQEGDIRE